MTMPASIVMCTCILTAVVPNLSIHARYIQRRNYLSYGCVGKQNVGAGIMLEKYQNIII